MSKLLEAESHFAFGENWKSFTSLIDQDRIAKSDEGVARLFAPGELTGKRVIDIGCGSGLPALSLLRAGAAHVTCVDIDPNSVSATRATLGQFAPADRWTAEVASVFTLKGQYDVVYSWGVLHHTGSMWRAIDTAAGLVKPGGLLTIALYRKTLLCPAWTVEKAIYSKAPRFIQRLIAAPYRWALLYARKRKGAAAYDARGMEIEHDIHDWLGGYPYESATPAAVRTFMAKLGFRERRSIAEEKMSHGIFGSGCDEYVFERTA